jgi:hypothetical protein
MEMKFEEESEDFGPVSAWRLLHRSVVEEQRVTVRGLAIQGKGVMVQTGRQYKTDDGGWSVPDYDSPEIIDDVLIMEYMRVTPSAIEDGNGQPVSITRQIVGREIVGVRMTKEKFQPKQQKKTGPGHYDHLEIRAGVVLTMETGPQPRQAPSIQVSETAEA